MSMLVRLKKEFIKSLIAIRDKLNKTDLELLSSLEGKFPDVHNGGDDENSNNEGLIEEDITWIEHLFATRRLKVIENLEDYSFYAGGVKWISFARDLAPYRQQPYLSIITPVLAQVEEFIQSLTVIKTKLNESDLEFLERLETKFPKVGTIREIPAGTLLDTDYFALIDDLFAKRWLKVADKFDDYTFYTGGVNAPWVSFAKSVAPSLQKPYLLLLIPVLANKDPNNFSRLKLVPDARSIFLSNNNSWHRLLSLYASGVFGIGGKQKKTRLKPLTLNELNRIRCKRGKKLAFKTNNSNSHNGNSYASFWDYVKREIAPTWQDNGACSTYLLPYLLEMIENYFEATNENGNFEIFQSSFKHFSNYLATCFISEVNNFYGAQIKVNEESYFLVEILLDCMQENRTGLSIKLISVARWICEIDPSLVSQNDRLKPAYEGLKVGANFDLNFLKDLVIALKVNDTSIVKDLHTELLSYLDLLINAAEIAEEEVRAELVRKIQAVYALRWDTIIDTKLDYTRYIKNAANHPWIRLAQFLAGAKYIKNYYRLLMPTLRYDYDLTHKELLTTYPLQLYIVSQNRDELIFLRNCMAHYKSNGTFSNCNYYEPRPLNSTEILRLAHAEPEIYRYFCRIEEKYDDPPISKETWNEIYDLVIHTLINVEGLTNPEIGKDAYDIATASYDKFLVYVNELPQDEKNSLYRHRILLRSRKVTVQEIMDLIQTPNYNWRVCVTGQAEILAKLIIDYAPNTKFPDIIEQNVNIESMRAHSTRKVYSDYKDLTDEEATRRILTIITSLMTHPFQYMVLTGKEISLGNVTNKVTDTGREIFLLVQEYLDKGDFKQARFLYAQLMEHIVKPAVNNTTWSRYPDTDDWLNRIQNGLLFDIKNEVYFEPQLLLIFLWSLAKTNAYFKENIKEFLDPYHKILISPDNSYKKWIAVNILFVNFLDNERFLSYRTNILQSLRISRLAADNHQLVYQSSKEYLIHRLAQMAARNYNYKAVGLFGSTPGHLQKVYEYFNREIAKKLEASMKIQNDEVPSLDQLVTKLILVSTQKKDLASMEKYLKQLAPIMPMDKNEQPRNSFPLIAF
ncbi:MAG: hypothetical protein H0T84_08335 [Tatlockia sp.]|nr:hypothetical protein [Tatlockia sp.]